MKDGMDCPVCKVDLMMTDRQGIEVDYCPKCRGVWLDRGELDKIIDRNAAEALAPMPAEPPGRWRDDYRLEGDRHRDYRRDDDDRIATTVITGADDAAPGRETYWISTEAGGFVPMRRAAAQRRGGG